MWRMISSYLSRLADSTDRTATVHDAAYALGVICFAVWLNHGIYKGKGFEPGWNQAAVTFACLVGGAKVFGGFSDRGANDVTQKEGAQ